MQVPKGAVCGPMQGYDIVFYGDSITENWRGTSGGLHWKQWDGSLDKDFIAADMRSVFLDAFGYKYRAGVMAIAGEIWAPQTLS